MSKLNSALHAIVNQGSDLAASTRARYLRDLDLFVEFAGALPESWTLARSRDFYAFLLGRMSPQSAQRSFSAIAYAGKRYAQAQQIEDFTAIDDDDTRDAPLTHDQAKLLLECTMGEHPLRLRDAAMIIVALETGMRRMSLRSMAFDQIELNHQVGYPVARVLMKGQGITRALVPLSHVAVMAITRWQTWIDRKRGPMFVALSIGGVRCVALKTALSDQGIHKIIAARGDEAGLRVHPNLFRDTFEAWRVADGFAPHEISALMCHGVGERQDLRDIGARVRESTPAWLREIYDETR